MKRLPSVCVLLLVVSAVLVAVPAAAAPVSGSGDSSGSFFDRAAAEMKNPLLSPCYSPAWRLIYTFVSNPGEEFDPDHCIQFFAVQAGDTAQCTLITRDPPMTKCYCLIASKKNDPSICDQIPATSDLQAYLRVDCLWEVAIHDNNPAACTAMGSEKISRMFVGEMSQTTCRARLASGQGVGESTL